MSFRGYQQFWPCDLDLLEFALPFANFKLANNFWTVRPKLPTFLTLWPWPWSLTYFLKTWTLLITFWTASSRGLIFHMSILWDKNTLWVPIILTLVTLTLAYFLKTFYHVNNNLIVSTRALLFHMNILVKRSVCWHFTFPFNQ